MTPEEMIGMMRRVPFEPFELHLNNGANFRVTQPDQAMVYPEGESLYLVANGKVERVSLINVAHVTSEAVS